MRGPRDFNCLSEASTEAYCYFAIADHTYKLRHCSLSSPPNKSETDIKNGANKTYASSKVRGTYRISRLILAMK